MKLFYSARFYNILLFFLVMMAGLCLWYNSNPPPSKKTTTSDNYDAFATDVVSTKFSPQGTKRYQLVTPRLNHYKRDNQTYVETPKLYLYSVEQDRWLVTAQYALAIHGSESISFVRHVDISGVGTTNHQHTQLLTEKITYFPEDNKASTSLPVTIVQPGSIIHATGMDVAFDTGTINLLSNISGSYNPNAS